MCGQKLSSDNDSTVLILIQMANTKRTKRKDAEGESSPHPDSDSGDELPQNEGNGDLVIDSLIHVHETGDSLLD